MKEDQQNIDRFLKNSLDGYHKPPPASAWKGVSRSLPYISTFMFLRYNRYYVAAVLFIGVLLTTIWLYNSKDINGNSAEKEIITNGKTDSLFQNTVSPSVSQTDTTVSITAPNKKASHRNKIEPDELKREIENNTDLVSTSVKSNEPFKDNLPFDSDSLTEAENITSSRHLDQQHAMPSLQTILLAGNYAVTNIPIRTYISSIYKETLYGPPSQKNYFAGSELRCAVNLYPEMAMTGNKLRPSYGFELTGLMVGKDYLFETGAGISRSDDNGRYQVRYSQYDSTGFYYKVSSFTIDPVTGNPVYNTSPEVVYDTLNYESSINTGDYYTYARFPLSTGIRVIDFKRISLWLKAGVVWSVLLSSEFNSPDFRNDKALYYTIENNTPSRIKSFWQLSAGLGLWYDANSRFSINVEPVYNLFMVPLYEQRYNIRSPYSLGLKAGIHVKF